MSHEAAAERASRSPAELAASVRALHIDERNGYGPGDCHCDECVETMDRIRALDEALQAADSLADTYGRMWVKDAKFYTYQDARAGLTPSRPSVKNGECGALSTIDGWYVICRGPAGHDGGHVWGHS